MDLKQTAIHEAGHVVVGYVLQLACKEVALTHDEVDETGEYGYAQGPHPHYGYSQAAHEINSTMLAESVACCAGLAAEHVFYEVPLDTDNNNAQNDFQIIINMESDELRIPGKKNGFVGDEATWQFIERQLRKAEKLVQKHRSAIERLADTLVEKEKLSGEEVENLLDEWISR